MFYVREETRGYADYETRYAEKPREDIQIALTVVGRRSERQIAIEPAGLIDLRGGAFGGCGFAKREIAERAFE